MMSIVLRINHWHYINQLHITHRQRGKGRTSAGPTCIRRPAVAGEPDITTVGGENTVSPERWRVGGLLSISAASALIVRTFWHLLAR